MLLRFYLRLTLILIALFTLVLILIHAQPYDDHELREFLLMKSCSSPCFMGIIPGETSHEEAINLLNENPWVEKITYEDDSNIQWAWSGQQPSWVNPMFEGSLSFYQDKVINIQFYSEILLGNILLSQTGFGRFQQFFYQKHQFISYSLYYPEPAIYFAFLLGCNAHSPYLQPIYVNIIGRSEASHRNTSTMSDSLPKPFSRCS